MKCIQRGRKEDIVVDLSQKDIKNTYQDYKLFTSDDDGSDAGSGFITRVANINVGWYEYQFNRANLHVASNASNINQSVKQYCVVDSEFIFTVTGDGDETQVELIDSDFTDVSEEGN